MGQPRYHRTQKAHGNNRKYNGPKPLGQRKAVLRGKFVAIQAYLEKQEKFPKNSLT